MLQRMTERFGVEVKTSPPSIPYRETITRPAEGHHRHKKQTGGAGQFGEVYLRVEPLPRGAGFEFVDDVVGGAIPGQFIPAVEKGVRQVLADGAIAGFPLQDVRVSVYDGKHHPVDSKEVAFVTAGKQGLRRARSRKRARSCSSRSCASRSARPSAVDRRRHQRPVDAARAHQRPGHAAGRALADLGAGAARGAAGLPVAAQGDHRRRRHLHDGPEPLRPGARAQAAGTGGGVQAAGGSRVGRRAAARTGTGPREALHRSALRALDPVPVTELGKADTRSVTGSGSSALAASQPGTSQACDPVPFPERVSAFPSSGNGTGSDVTATG